MAFNDNLGIPKRIDIPEFKWFNDKANIFKIPSQYGAITNRTVLYRREGDSLRVHGSFTCGTIASGDSSIVLPSGLHLDLSLYSSTSIGEPGPQIIVGNMSSTTTSPTALVLYYMIIDPIAGIDNRVHTCLQTSTDSWDKSVAASFATTNENINFNFLVPILEWQHAP